jgi:hypothetical protein
VCHSHSIAPSSTINTLENILRVSVTIDHNIKENREVEAERMNRFGRRTKMVPAAVQGSQIPI